MSTTPKHTPEPWIVSDDNEPLRVGGNGQYPPAYMPRDGRPFIMGIEADGRHHLPSGADLRRAVACVNACAGIEDPAAELERLRAVEVLAKTVADMNWFKTTGLNFAAMSALRTALGTK